jgi:nucleotide-binding universal stress UspA family protein
MSSTRKTASGTTAITGPASDAIIDLDALAYLDTAEVNIVHPGDKKTVIATLTVAGPAHPITLAQDEEERRAALAETEAYQREQQEAIIAGKPAPRSPEARRTLDEIRARNAKSVAARIIGASGRFKFQGEVFDLTPSTAATILAHPSVPFIYEQVFTALRNRETFLPASAKP